MTQSKLLTAKDLLLLLVLKHAGYETSIRSVQELENDPKALEIYQSEKTIRWDTYRFWPHDPKGGSITLDNSCFGKMASNKMQFWGATLWDFYYIHRIPSVPTLRTVSTASKLLKWMNKQGETDYAKDEMISAANEEDPCEIFPFPISEVIEAQEMNIRLGIYGIPKPIDKDSQRSDEAKGVFSPESFPAPWPLLPFSYEAAPLEHHIPFYQLPSTLVVHDPWDLLSVSKTANRYLDEDYDWASSKDRTYLYHQCVSSEGEERTKEEHKTREEEKTRRRLKPLQDLLIDGIIPDNLDAMLLVPSLVKPGPSEPPIVVLYDAAPVPELTEIAHLYLSPQNIIGEGHHSLIVDAEWEIPRSLVVPDILCYECILEDVHQTLLASDGADGSMKEERWKRKSGVWHEHHVGRPAEVVEFDKIRLYWENPPPNPMQPTATYVLRSGNLETKYDYFGPPRPIKTKVMRQNGENYCSHISRRLHINEGTRAHPLSAKVSVAAKLSREYDFHLNDEFIIYQKFPRHFFEHWSGYNVIAPFETPTPVGAVVPQYYGYYKPPEDASCEWQYLSPIMLLEKCGRDVVVDDLNMDDRFECASLFYRLHNEGYIHQSVFPRNVLCQDGPLDRPMYQRGTGGFTEDGRKHSFRVIDFGRARKLCVGDLLISEEREDVGEMTKHTYYDT